MAQIVLNPGLTMANLPPAQLTRMIDADWLASQVANMRQEWQDTGADLSKVTVNLAQVFDDLNDLIGGE